MTEEEAWALDELVTRKAPRVDPSKARHVARMVAIDDFSADSPYVRRHRNPQDPVGNHQRDDP